LISQINRKLHVLKTSDDYQGGVQMPNATIEGPKIEDVGIKRVLVKEITDALEKAYKLPRQVYTVLIKENPPENVGSGGRLILDRKET
jgi:4-oxalocrotonate tautomerase family enzyme